MNYDLNIIPDLRGVIYPLFLHLLWKFIFKLRLHHHHYLLKEILLEVNYFNILV
jgi:hypothetical protein